jgi:hypothetical protein
MAKWGMSKSYFAFNRTSMTQSHFEMLTCASLVKEYKPLIVETGS